MPVGIANPFVSEGITDNFSGSFAKQAEEGRNFNYNRVRTGYGTTKDGRGNTIKGKYKIVERVVGGQIVGRTSQFKAFKNQDSIIESNIPVGEFINSNDLQKLTSGNVMKGIPRVQVNGQPVLNTIGPDELPVDGGDRNTSRSNVKAPDRRALKRGFNEHLFSGELIDNQVVGPKMNVDVGGGGAEEGDPIDVVTGVELSGSGLVVSKKTINVAGATDADDTIIPTEDCGATP